MTAVTPTYTHNTIRPRPKGLLFECARRPHRAPTLLSPHTQADTQTGITQDKPSPQTSRAHNSVGNNRATRPTTIGTHRWKLIRRINFATNMKERKITLFTNDATTGRVEPTDSQKKSAITNFRNMEKVEQKNDADTLRAWWKCANDCREMYGNVYGAPSDYARLVAKVSQTNSENTIRQYVKAIMDVQEIINTATGKKFRLTDFTKNGLGIGHVRATVANPKKKSSKAEPFRQPPLRKVSASTRKAYEGLMATAEFRSLPADEKKFIRMLARGEHFYSGWLN